ncbi:MAG: hypothetical protein WKF96_01110 [Solirubrobacteraceae bacterium]
MFSEFHAFERGDDREDCIVEVHRQLRRRLATDRLLTAESVAWARDRVRCDEHAGIGADGAFSVLELKVRMTHMAGQYAAISRAIEELRPKFSPDRADQLQEVYFELLRRIEAHPAWVCEKGRPCVKAARAALAQRLGFRDTDARRYRERFIGHDGSDPAIFGIEEHECFGLLCDNALDAFVRERLADADLPKWNRFCRWTLQGVSQEHLAHEAGMSHAAVRKEVTRLRVLLTPIAAAWRRASAEPRDAKDQEEGDQADIVGFARAG